LLCKKDSDKSEFYIGITSDLKKRVQQHKNRCVKSTKGFDSVELVYYEACKNKTDARHRENQLKTGFGRGYLKRRLENFVQI
ncbi:MAG: GIY-YIG nuclease family protein, partial [Patescibacteria group bacterium]